MPEKIIPQKKIIPLIRKFREFFLKKRNAKKILPQGRGGVLDGCRQGSRGFNGFYQDAKLPAHEQVTLKDDFNRCDGINYNLGHLVPSSLVSCVPMIKKEMKEMKEIRSEKKENSSGKTENNKKNSNSSGEKIPTDKTETQKAVPTNLNALVLSTEGSEAFECDGESGDMDAQERMWRYPWIILKVKPILSRTIFR
jgi:hypothetical protein